ncbi:hypothetical protein [Bacillus mycoides]|uniref:hypothetical protein n=1 Tax=Bacillus mycoides TaxID=1405 RepID=UPI001642DD3F|nr:hypothetical protein [Bacillus mycoides]
MSYPIASVVALWGGLFIMVGSQERGFSLISRAGISPTRIGLFFNFFQLEISWIVLL